MFYKPAISIVLDLEAAFNSVDCASHWRRFRWIHFPNPISLYQQRVSHSSSLRQLIFPRLSFVSFPVNFFQIIFRFSSHSREPFAFRTTAELHITTEKDFYYYHGKVYCFKHNQIEQQKFAHQMFSTFELNKNIDSCTLHGMNLLSRKPWVWPMKVIGISVTSRRAINHGRKMDIAVCL